MIHWSIIPPETVFAGFDDPHQQPVIHTISYRGVTMEVEVIGPAEFKIHRLISPCANDYLRAEWMPGQVVQLL